MPGRVQITSLKFNPRFAKDLKGLPVEIQKEVHAALADLQREVIPSKRRLHQLENYKDPKIHTIDVLSNHSYKISLEIDGATATLRRVATHKTIDRTP